MSTTIDIAALRAKLRVYDQTLPRCQKRIVRVSNHAPDYVAEEERGEWEMRLTYPCGELEGHEGQCREGRAVLGWPGFATLTALLDEVERLRDNAEARERVMRREADLLRAAQREVDELRAEVERTEHLRSSLDTALMLERERERAAVVAYLRDEAEMFPDDPGALRKATDAIEVGLHRGKGER